MFSKCSLCIGIVFKATETWDLTARRFINYRSFKPILRLIPMFDAPASQHWAIWALANLTSTDSKFFRQTYVISFFFYFRGIVKYFLEEKYCAYVCNEGGVPLLEVVEKDPRSSDSMRKLASIVLENIRRW